MILLMVYLAICERKRMCMQLEWRPRESNVEADDLTNLVFDRFDMAKCIEIARSELKFPVIELLMKFTESFSKGNLTWKINRVSAPCRSLQNQNGGE